MAKQNGFIKNKLLEVGQRVWMETYPVFYQGKSSIHEYEVVEANTSSAYLESASDIDAGRNTKYRIRVEQRTKKVIVRYTAGYGYTLWNAEEDYIKSKELMKEKASMRSQAIDRVSKMTLDELKEFLGRWEK